MRHLFVVMATMTTSMAIHARADAAWQIWEVEDDACAAKDSLVDSQGNLYVGCYSMVERQWRMTSYDPNGTLIAEQELNGLANEATPMGAYIRPTHLALDEALGRLYAVGSLSNGLEFQSVAGVVAFDLADLGLLWTTTLTTQDTAWAVALYPDGGLALMGGHHNGTDTDLLIARLGADGETEWQSVYNSGGDDAGTTSFQNIVVDAHGNAYGVGQNVVVKVNAQGAREWAITRPALKLVLQDDLYLVVTTPLNPHGQTALYDLDGGLLWEAPIGGMYAATSDDGAIWTARTEYLDSSNADWEIARLSGAGEVLWTFTLGKRKQDLVRGIAVDDLGNAYITGSARIRGGFLNLFWVERTTTIKLSPSGGQRWRKNWAGGTDPDEILLAGENTIYVPGLTAHVAYGQ